MLRGKINKIGFEEIKQLKNKKPNVNVLRDSLVITHLILFFVKNKVK
jgi:hypothetical protein